VVNSPISSESNSKVESFDEAYYLEKIDYDEHIRKHNLKTYVRYLISLILIRFIMIK